MQKTKRNTIQRQLILDTMEKLDIHANAEQVYAYVKKKYPSIGKATIYRNLGYMSESGELANVGSFYGSTHYDHRTHAHYHFICEDCRKIIDVENVFPEFCEEVAKANNFVVKSHNLIFSGLCGDCRNKPENS